jgi:hypothetical protein
MDLITKTLNIMEDEQIDPKEKDKIFWDLTLWIRELSDHNDIDMLYQLIDMKTVWEEEIERNSPEDKSL